MSPDRERRRPMRLHNGPQAPTQEPQEPGMAMVRFHFVGGGDVTQPFPVEKLRQVAEAVGHAWNSRDGQMLTVGDEDGTPSLLIRLSEVRIVEFL